MASSSSSKHLSLFFLLLLSSSLQIHGRDSQFFSKVTPYSTTNHEVKETDHTNIPQNEVSSFEQPNLNQPENKNGYGLYGHDQVDDQFSPTTTNSVHYSTSSNLPAGDNFARENTQFNNNNNGYETKQNSVSDPRYQENGNYYDNNNGYNSKPNSFNEPRYQENGNNNYNNGYRTEKYNGNNNGYRSEQYNNNFNNDGYRREQYRSSSSNNNRYPAERQGMSDTRFMENGRYFYALNSENSYPNEYQNSRGASRENGSSSNRGVEGRNHQYYNNNGGYSYGNNGNPNEFSRNSMGDQYQSNVENFENQEEFDP